MANDFYSQLNFAYGKVLTAPSPALSGTTLTLLSGEGANFPDPATVGDYPITIWANGTLPQKSNAEVLLVTGKSGDILTVTRTIEGSTARAVAIGDQVAMTITADVIAKVSKAVWVHNTQSSHGFSAGDAIYHNGTIWTKAKADAGNTLATHVVGAVFDTNNFVMVSSGKITMTSHGFTPGSYYYVSDATAGAFTLTAPNIYRQPNLYVEDADTLHVFPSRPDAIVKTYRIIVDASGNGTHTTLQSAYDSAGDYEKILVLSGNVLDELVTFDNTKTHVTIDAYGAKLQYTSPGAGTYIPLLFLGDSSTDCRYHRLNGIVVIGADSTTERIYGIRMSYASKNLLRDVITQDVYMNSLTNSNYNVFERIELINTTLHGLRFSDGSARNSVDGFIVDTTKAGVTGQAIYIYNNSGDNTGNRFSNGYITGADQAGMRLEADYTYVDRVIGEACGYHIFRAAGDRSGGNHCKFESCIAIGAITYHNYYLNVVDHCEILNCFSDSPGQSGIDISGSNNRVVGFEGKNASQASPGNYSQINLAGNVSTTEDNLISNVHVYDDQGSPTQNWGINHDGTVSRTTIEKVTGSGSISGLIKPFTAGDRNQVIATPDVATKTAHYTILMEDDITAIDATSGAITATLPSAVGIRGKRFVIKRVDLTSNVVTLATTGSETIDGQLLLYLAGYDGITVVSNNSNWLII